MRPHTQISRVAVVAMILLALVQGVRLLDGRHDAYVAALLITFVTVTSCVAVKLCRDNCIESRISAGLLALLTGSGVALAATVGMPGQAVHSLGLLDAVTLVLSIAAFGLLVVDQPQRIVDRREKSPYAS